MHAAAMRELKVSKDPKSLSATEKEFEVTELKKNALDPVGQFVFL